MLILIYLHQKTSGYKKFQLHSFTATQIGTNLLIQNGGFFIAIVRKAEKQQYFKLRYMIEETFGIGIKSFGIFLVSLTVN